MNFELTSEDIFRNSARVLSRPETRHWLASLLFFSSSLPFSNLSYRVYETWGRLIHPKLHKNQQMMMKMIKITR
jgi:hypothetical protein